jgi:hypothetical protein
MEISGIYDVLFRLSDDEPTSESDLNLQDDYCRVINPLPLQEFTYPIELLTQLDNDPGRYGKLPRPIRRFDVINIKPRKPYRSRALLVIDVEKDLGFLTITDKQVQVSEATGLALAPLNELIK